MLWRTESHSDRGPQDEVVLGSNKKKQWPMRTRNKKKMAAGEKMTDVPKKKWKKNDLTGERKMAAR